MFCPSCGHDQINEEIKYCSKCGFSFEIVAQVLSYGGSLPPSAEGDNKQKGWFSRSSSWKYGLLWFLFFVILLAPLLAIAGVDALPELTALFGFFGAILITLFPFIFFRKQPRARNSGQFAEPQNASEYNSLSVKRDRNLLPPQESMPASAYVQSANSWKAPDTFDLVSPSSITERTTNLLEKKNRFD